jgi:predicted nucleic acid-binding protein
MNFMKDKTFFDTNVLVYGFDRSNREKYDVASGLIREAYEKRVGVISTQVLKEFYVTVTQKIPRKMDMADAEQAVRDFSVWTVVETDVALILRAIHIQRRYSLSFWDAMVVAAAKVSTCITLLTEDLSHDTFLDDVYILNPFEIPGPS